MSYESIRKAVGGSIEDGKAYHDIPGKAGRTFRNDSQKRADQIAEHIDVNGKTGIDLGCSVGGVSFGLVAHGATMLGYDHDRTAIELANEHAEDHNLDATFHVADLADEQGWSKIVQPGPDFVVWLANWMWIAKAAGVDAARNRLRQVSEHVGTLAFETAQGAGGSMAGTFGMRTNDDVADLLHGAGFTDVHCVPVVDGWHGRSLFIARRT